MTFTGGLKMNIELCRTMTDDELMRYVLCTSTATPLERLIAERFELLQTKFETVTDKLTECELREAAWAAT